MSKTRPIIQKVLPTIRTRTSVSKRKTDRWNFTINANSNVNIVLTMVRSTNAVLNCFLYNSLNVELSKFTLNNSNLTFNQTIQLNTGSYYILVINNTSRTINYSISATSSPIVEPTPDTTPPSSSSKKVALVVAISDYLYINDLSYCDEDAVAWCNYLVSKGYEITLLGDRTSLYGSFSKADLATEANIKKHMNLLNASLSSGDQFVFISSGHGSGDGKGNSFICCLDENFVSEGEYTDKELAIDVKKFTDKQVKVILFFDNCFSGGLIPEVIGVDPRIVCASSTCTQNGYGYDVSSYKHGAWTYSFLVQTLSKNPNLNMNDAFTRALLGYPYKGGDTPQLGGNGSLSF
jgi:hypothetical protein